MVHRQCDRRMAGQGLRDFWMQANCGQVADVNMAERMEIEDATIRITVLQESDPSHSFDIAVSNLATFGSWKLVELSTPRTLQNLGSPVFRVKKLGPFLNS